MIDAEDPTIKGVAADLQRFDLETYRFEPAHTERRAAHFPEIATSAAEGVG
jgi:hypothetical protein